jgi:hypothetical protein
LVLYRHSGKSSREHLLLLLLNFPQLQLKSSTPLAPSSLPIPEALPDTFHENGIHIDSETNQTTAEKDWIKEVKLEFEKSADPWGRIVVYGVELLSDYTGEF